MARRLLFALQGTRKSRKRGGAREIPGNPCIHGCQISYKEKTGTGDCPVRRREMEVFSDDFTIVDF